MRRGLAHRGPDSCACLASDAPRRALQQAVPQLLRRAPAPSRAGAPSSRHCCLCPCLRLPSNEGPAESHSCPGKPEGTSVVLGVPGSFQVTDKPCSSSPENTWPTDSLVIPQPRTPYHAVAGPAPREGRGGDVWWAEHSKTPKHRCWWGESEAAFSWAITRGQNAGHKRPLVLRTAEAFGGAWGAGRASAAHCPPHPLAEKRSG